MIQDIAPHKYYVDYQPSVPNDTDLVLIYGHHTIMCNFEDPEIRYPSIAEITAVFPEIKEKAKFLFRIDETDYYELRSPQLPEFGIWKYENTLILRSAVPGWLGFAGITGYQIHTWYTDHTYCGRCGTKMHAPGNERAMQCPSCGALRGPSAARCSPDFTAMWTAIRPLPSTARNSPLPNGLTVLPSRRPRTSSA